MYTAPRAKEIAEQNRSAQVVFFYIDKQVTEELNLGKRCTSFTHEGLADPLIKEEVIKDLRRLDYVVYPCLVNVNRIDIYWDQ